MYGKLRLRISSIGLSDEVRALVGTCVEVCDGGLIVLESCFER